jgi:hypothetical protein
MYPEKIKIALISCVSQKLNYSARIKDLYTSPLFKKTWDYVVKFEKPKDIYILSAMHGLIKWDSMCDPYDKTLLDMSKDECLEWAEKVKKQITETLGEDLNRYEFVLFAGSKYYENLLDFFPKDSLHMPLGKLPIGKRLGALSSALKSGKKIVWEDFK